MSKEEIGVVNSKGFIPKKLELLKPINEEGNNFYLERGLYVIKCKYKPYSEGLSPLIKQNVASIINEEGFDLSWIKYDCETKILTAPEKYSDHNGYTFHLDNVEVVCIAEY